MKHMSRTAVWSLAFIALASATQAPTGTVVTRELRSEALDRSWAYAAYLPNGYASSNLRYPVLYLLHGAGGNMCEWIDKAGIQRTADALVASGDIPPTVIIMPDAGTSWYVDGKEKMETAIVNELIPDVEKRFRVLVNRDGRLIAGLSMGGYGAMRFALRYPEMFAAAGLLSPAIYNPEPPEGSSARDAFGTPAYDPSVWKAHNYPALMEDYLAKNKPVPMYINSGDDDEFLLGFQAVRFYELLREHEQPAELRIVDGAHSFSVWESTIGDALKYMFRFSARPTVMAPVR